MQTRRAQIWIFVCVLLAITIITIIAAVASRGAQSTGGSSFVSTTAAPIIASDHAKVAVQPLATVIEYGDYECPACAAYEPLVEKLEATYGGKVTFVFRNFPLTQIHQNALPSAEAAEAAALQGKFWEMHNMLYQKQTEWSTESPSTVTTKYFDVYAHTLGLDVAKFNADMNAASVTSKIQADTQSGNDAKVDHTPTFFINRAQIQNPTTYEQFAALIDAAIASSTTR